MTAAAHDVRMSPAARLLSIILVGYQRFLSPLLAPRCRFEPSCSSYAREAVVVHGAGRGTLLACWRLLRCQPFGTPGYDPVPERHRATTEQGAPALRGAHRC
jgi:hypothetical protein